MLLSILIVAIYPSKDTEKYITDDKTVWSNIIFPFSGNIYYINMHILYVFVCVCVHVSVIFEISGIGGRSAALLALT